MTWLLDVRPRAASDLAAARDWYNEQRTGLGFQFEDEAISVIRDAVSAPHQFPVTYRRTHRALLTRFPYAVYYRLVGETLVVVAVMHTRRHPRMWQVRDVRPAYGRPAMAA